MCSREFNTLASLAIT